MPARPVLCGRGRSPAGPDAGYEERNPKEGRDNGNGAPVEIKG